ncbi:MAG: ABC transporter ATP-binding protein [Synergistaceae bacterium]|jgi:putative ABC transport system ATP-binding protein|nr:ABC transporter ATP-binding protein [Synergistaceae bacterium]
MLLEIRKLRKEYRRGDAGFLAVNDVDISVGENDFIFITGRSGSGKSTLLNLIAGLARPSSGKIVFDGRDIGGANEKELAFLRNSQIGYIPQGHGILFNFTVLDNVLLPFYFYSREGDPKKRALSLLEQTGIPHLVGSYPDQLSGGELRRVSIARSLINSPCLLIADEPTGDLDPQTTNDILRMFERISAEGVTIILVTHEVDTVSCGNRHLIMEEGFIREADCFQRYP